jgi:putative membrane protein
MSKRKILNRMLGVATLAMMFGTASVYAQSTAPDASGKTPENKVGKMSITGQSETSSVQPPTAGTSGTSGASGTSGSSSSMGDAAATKMDASGQTPADKAGKMSPTGQSETTSGKPMTSGASDTTGSSASGAAASGSVSKSDQKMMQDLAQANMSEIEAAKLAQQKSSSEDVKSFAQKMIDDHTKAGEQLQQLAQSKGVTLPTEPDSKHQAELKKLGALSGDKFDKMYTAQGGVTDHRKTHALLSHIQKSAKDNDLKTLASNLAPTVDEHWQMAKNMKSGKASSATGASGTSSKSKSSGPSSDSSSSTGK